MSTALRLTPWQHFILLSSGVTIFYSSHWEEYFSHHLVLGKLANPTEAQCFMMAVLVIAGIYGPQIYSTQLSRFPVTAKLPFEIRQLSISDIFIIGILLICVWCLISNAITVMNIIKQKHSSVYGFKPIFPVIVQNILMIIWVVFSKTNIIATGMTPLSVLNGVVSSFICDELVIHRMTRMNFSPIRPVLLFPFIGALNSVFGSPIDEYYLLVTLMGTLLSVYIYFLYSVAQQFTDNLNIYFFSVEKRPPRHLVKLQ